MLCPSKPRLALVEKCGDIFTTPLFWDCECENDYIHACLEETCLVCKATQKNHPMPAWMKFFATTELNDKLIAALEMICERICPDLVPIPF